MQALILTQQGADIFYNHSMQNITRKILYFTVALCTVSQTPTWAAGSEPLVLAAGAAVDNHFSSHPQTWEQVIAKLRKRPGYRPSVRKMGLFVTLSKHGETRACWGNLTNQYRDDLEAVVYTTELALTKEYRHPPIKSSELVDIKPQVTLIEAIEPITGKGRATGSLQPMVDGLMARSQGKSGILLPGEAKDPYFQVMQCKLKAGIKPSEPCQLYRIKAHVIR